MRKFVLCGLTIGTLLSLSPLLPMGDKKVGKGQRYGWKLDLDFHQAKRKKYEGDLKTKKREEIERILSNYKTEIEEWIGPKTGKLTGKSYCCNAVYTLITTFFPLVLEGRLDAGNCFKKNCDLLRAVKFILDAGGQQELRQGLLNIFVDREKKKKNRRSDFLLKKSLGRIFGDENLDTGDYLIYTSEFKVFASDLQKCKKLTYNNVGFAALFDNQKIGCWRFTPEGGVIFVSSFDLVLEDPKAIITSFFLCPDDCLKLCVKISSGKMVQYDIEKDKETVVSEEDFPKDRSSIFSNRWSFIQMPNEKDVSVYDIQRNMVWVKIIFPDQQTDNFFNWFVHNRSDNEDQLIAFTHDLFFSLTLSTRTVGVLPYILYHINNGKKCDGDGKIEEPILVQQEPVQEPVLEVPLDLNFEELLSNSPKNDFDFPLFD
ncbi:MAG: hypothetical protein JW725_04610 [Candidatus Babeliaceae bacterium]|nr:hypothetical protein [Candidatus Babeliaceae bacterium]